MIVQTKFRGHIYNYTRHLSTFHDFADSINREGHSSFTLPTPSYADVVEQCHRITPPTKWLAITVDFYPDFLK